MKIQDIINEIFESQEMKDYLCERAEELHKWDIKDMVAASPMSTVQRKLEMLEWLAQGEDLEKEIAEGGSGRDSVIKFSYAEIVKNTKAALDALYDTTKPAVFLVRFLANWGSEDDECKEAELIPFTSYEKAVQYMKKQEEKYGDYRIWFDVEKWDQDENGNLEQTWTYVVLKGKVIYFSHEDYHYHFSTCTQNKDLNLPVPFKAGDILEIQDMPFARRRHALILDIGDNKDCCAVWHLYINEDGCIKANAFKHGHIFECWYATSPLYSAKIFQGVLEGEEEVLHIIQNFVKKLPLTEERGHQFFEIFNKYIPNNKIHSRDITEELLNDIYDKVLQGNGNT